MISNDVLASGWKWSVLEHRKVRKEGGTNIKVKGASLAVEFGRNTGIHGSWKLEMTKTFPYLKLILLTHYADEIIRTVEDKVR